MSTNTLEQMKEAGTAVEITEMASHQSAPGASGAPTSMFRLDDGRIIEQVHATWQAAGYTREITGEWADNLNAYIEAQAAERAYFANPSNA